MRVELETAGPASEVVRAFTSVANAANARGWPVRVQDPVALGKGGRFAIDLPNLSEEGEARGLVEALMRPIPGADTLLTIRRVGTEAPVSLDGCRAKLARSTEHFDSLGSEYEHWFGDGRGIIETVEADERAADGGSVWLVSRCSRVLREPPARWGLIIGDAVHNLRAALDHLACRLVELSGNTPTRATAFPIWDRDPHADRGDQQRFERFLAGMRPEDAEAIRRLQPYQNPSSDESAKLMALVALNNLDKHRVILPVLMNFQEEIPLTTWTVTGPRDGVELIVNRGVQITPGVELARARTLSGRPEMGVNIGFELGIAYGPVDPPCRLAELREIHSYVAAIVESFAPAFA